MKEQTFVVSVPPHIQSVETTQKIMFTTTIVLLPTVLAAIYFFGLGALKVIIISVTAAVAFEAALQKIMRRDITIKDGSAVLMGLLFGCILPPTAPWWMIILGVAVGMVAGKHIYGGLGSNPFNPVLVGWAALRLSFPTHLDRSATPLGVLKYQGVDAVLEKFKYDEAKIGVTYCSAGENFKPLKKESLQSFIKKTNLPSKFFVAVGTLAPRKNYTNLLKAFAQIVKKHPDYQLVIVGGKGWHFEEIYQIVKAKL